jgi:hypothetical protein
MEQYSRSFLTLETFEKQLKTQEPGNSGWNI